MTRRLRWLNPPRDHSGTELPHTFGDFSDHAALIVLGDPGAGKTHLFRESATASEARLITARSFLSTPAQHLTGRDLFIDGLDEKRGGRGDRDTVDALVEKLFDVNPPKVRLSCRAADWLGESDLAALRPFFEQTAEPLVLLLERLEADDQRAVLAGQGVGADDAAAFLAEVQQRGLGEFLENPQNLIMLWRAVQTGSWPATRSDVFELSTRLMLQEFDQDRARAGTGERGRFRRGQNVSVEYHSADGQPDRLLAALAAFIRRDVAVIVAAGSGVALAAKAATASIPIVFAGGSDPVAVGLVASLNRPGGNITGVTIISHVIDAKRLETLRLLIPNAGSIALIVEPANPSTPTVVRETQTAASALGLQTTVYKADSALSLEAAFAAAAQQKVGGLLIGGGPLLGDLRIKVTALAASHRLPAIYSLREYVEVGGLMSYGSDFVDSYRQAGAYVGRILKGEKAADLPVQQPTKFELVINLKAAKSLGLAIPDKLLALADEVLE